MDPQTCKPLEGPGVSYIDGDTRLVTNNASTIAKEFTRQGYYNTLKTPLFAAFFSPRNIEYIKSQIEKALHILTQERVVVPINDEFMQTMIDIAQSNVGLAYAPMATALLNRAVIDAETRVQFSSLRQKKLYERYFLTGDRMRTMPYGEYTRSTRGEVTISNSDYRLSHPISRFRPSYLRATAGLERRNGPDGPGYTPIPNFLLPTVPKPTSKLQRSPTECYMDQMNCN